MDSEPALLQYVIKASHPRQNIFRWPFCTLSAFCLWRCW